MTELDRRFDDPDAYDDAESFDGNGWLPPDWRARRAAIRERQDGQCGTCGRTPAGELVVAHVRDPSEGGDHRLQNLVGQCPTCAKRAELVTKTSVPSAKKSWKRRARPDRTYSRPVLAGTLVLVAGTYVTTLHRAAGPEAPASLLAYVPWLVGRQIDGFFEFIQPLVNFVGIVILIIILAWAFGSY